MLNFQSDTSANRKILSIVLTFALAISMIPTLILTEVSNADENESEQATSLKDFERGVVYQGRQRTQEEIEKLQSQGCIVDEFDASDINYKESVNKTSSANLASESKTLPEKVDLRSTGKVTSVKSQIPLALQPRTIRRFNWHTLELRHFLQTPPT